MEEKSGKSLEQMMEEASSALDDFEASHGLSRPSVPSETDDILSMSYQRLEKLTPVECAEYSYQLAQYAYYIQRVSNRESSTLKWLQDMQWKLTCNKMHNYDKFWKHEIKMNLIAKENDVVNRLVKLISYTEQKIERIQFLGNTIIKMADKLDNLQRAKSYQRG